MGGLSKKIRWTYLTMLTATLAIAGAPLFAGFFSKDAILFATYQHQPGGPVLYFFGLLTALLTSFYMFRLIFLTFYGEQRYDEHHVHVHESPKSMLIPLAVLAVLSIFGGWLALPAFWGGPDYFANFLSPVFGLPEAAAGTEAASRTTELLFALGAATIALIGFLIAMSFYRKATGKPESLAKSMSGVYSTLLHKYYVDELYAVVVVKPLLWVSRNFLWQTIDVSAIDGTVNGIAAGAVGLGDEVRHAQSGNTRSYAVWVVIGALVIIGIVFWPYFKATSVGLVR